MPFVPSPPSTCLGLRLADDAAMPFDDLPAAGRDDDADDFALDDAILAVSRSSSYPLAALVRLPSLSLPAPSVAGIVASQPVRPLDVRLRADP